MEDTSVRNKLPAA
ncbi:hypothetical protein FOXB_11774 [Fusarium oxysporum f. sp. conglutinans Fo5176]|uniref:Uncharacterized protein n=1 Tax=Fusarium oxysporum (strain Fo5176) TaxID=660025 RepID=F9FZE2_FUSOF|nr:hypothetical protein FOXB_11774 [Fusarium oxysporum f. sp. conglutinans Fo5176]